MEQTLPAGHPVHTYMLEADLIYSLMDELLGIDPHTDYQKFYNVFNHLATVEKHFARKENQLFPFLENAVGQTLHKICGLSTILFAISSAWCAKT